MNAMFQVIGIHCRQGRSRSGVMLACYLVHFHRFMPDQAMNTIRMIRTGKEERKILILRNEKTK
jgi:protein-tyrosine phosphatase